MLADAVIAAADVTPKWLRAQACSQPPEGQDQLGELVLAKVLRILADAKIIAALAPPGTAPGRRD